MSSTPTYGEVFTPKPKKMGRPKGSGKIKPAAHKSTMPAKLSPELWAFIQANRWYDETISETIFRLIRQANHNSIKAQKKVDALERRLLEIEALTQLTEPLLNDYCETR